MGKLALDFLLGSLTNVHAAFKPLLSWAGTYWEGVLGLVLSSGIVVFFFQEIFGWHRKAKLIIGTAFKEKQEWGDTPHYSLHVRLPVTAKGTDVEEVKAEIIGGSKELQPYSERMLFWVREFDPHEHPKVEKSPKYIADHLKIHYKAARPIRIYDGETRHVNLLVKIPGYDKIQLPARSGEERIL